LAMTDEHDLWTYIWGNNQYSSARAYKHLKGEIQIHPTFNWLWKSSCQLKHKFFFLASSKG